MAFTLQGPGRSVRQRSADRTGNSPEARRAEHFFSEAARVNRGADRWRAGDLPALGHLVNASGASSADNYEVTPNCHPVSGVERICLQQTTSEHFCAEPLRSQNSRNRRLSVTIPDMTN